MALLLAAMAMLSSCGVLSSLVNTEQALRDAGYQSVGVNFDLSNSEDGVKVRVSVDAPATQTDVQDVARVVWYNLHERFAFLDVSVHGTGGGVGADQTGDYTFDDLQSLFGPRNPNWNKTSVGQSAGEIS